MMKRMFAILAVPLLVLAAGCYPKPGAAGEEGPMTEVSVEVSNGNRRDVTVYLMRGSTRTRLGTTVSGATTLFPVRNVRIQMLNDVRLVAEVIGSDDGYMTQRIPVGPGQRIYFRVEDLLSSSQIRLGMPGR